MNLVWCLCTVFDWLKGVSALNLFSSYAVSSWCLLLTIFILLICTLFYEVVSTALWGLLWPPCLGWKGRGSGADKEHLEEREKPRSCRVHPTISLVTCATSATYNLLRYLYNTNVERSHRSFILIERWAEDEEEERKPVGGKKVKGRFDPTDKTVVSSACGVTSQSAGLL